MHLDFINCTSAEIDKLIKAHEEILEDRKPKSANEQLDALLGL
jgi:hypothetical protein